MKKHGKRILQISFLLLFVLLVVCVAQFILSTLKKSERCDMELYLIDHELKQKLDAALYEFQLEHDVKFGQHHVASCIEKGPLTADIDIYTGLEYQTPSRFSQHGIVYRLEMSAIYSPDSETVELSIHDSVYNETDGVLQFINSLEAEIAEFEGLPQVEEFCTHFVREGSSIRGHIDGNSLRIETNPDFDRFRYTPSASADILYSMAVHKIIFYSLPNRILWETFPEFVTAHKIINENLLVDEWSKCIISKENGAYENTDVSLDDDRLTRVGVRLSCDGSKGSDYLRLILHPDNSYEYEYQGKSDNTGE